MGKSGRGKFDEFGESSVICQAKSFKLILYLQLITFCQIYLFAKHFLSNAQLGKSKFSNHSSHQTSPLYGSYSRTDRLYSDYLKQEQ